MIFWNSTRVLGVIDIGCGKGEMLIGLAEKYDIKGLGATWI
jgi:cyclopropane fatty-acyl-phospholipid synthase-like methyltransferase